MRVFLICLFLGWIGIQGFAQSSGLSSKPSWQAGQIYVLTTNTKSMIKNENGDELQNSGSINEIRIISSEQSGHEVEVQVTHPLTGFDAVDINYESEEAAKGEYKEVVESIPVRVKISPDCKHFEVIQIDLLRTELLKKKESILQNYLESPENMESLGSVIDELLQTDKLKQSLNAEVRPVMYYFLFQHQSSINNAADTVVTKEMAPNPFDPEDKIARTLKKYMSSENPLEIREDFLIDAAELRRILKNINDKMESIGMEDRSRNKNQLRIDHFTIGTFSPDAGLIDSLKSVNIIRLKDDVTQSLTEVKIKKK